MKKTGLLILLLLFLFSPFFSQGMKKSKVTTGSLFQEMIDMTRLAEFPDPFFRTVQFSSYDHRSRLPGGPHWFANADGFGKEPVPNFQQVLEKPDKNGVGRYLIADVGGPGAIVRLWTAAIAGNVRVYIDHSRKAVFDGEASSFFRRPYDFFPAYKKKLKEKLFNKTIYQRDASYAPIPFAKHLRVEWIGKVADIHFYQLQVRLYEPGTDVVSFTAKDLSAYRHIIDNVSSTLFDPDVRTAKTPVRPRRGFRVLLPGRQTKGIFSIDGQLMLVQMIIKIEAEDMDQALRQNVLHIVCDGHPWAQVQSPIGDFFGAAPGVNPYQSMPFTVRTDGNMVCRYVMPFRQSMKIMVENLGKQPVEISGSANFEPYRWHSNSLHFYARWRVNHNLTASNKKVIDLPFLNLSGKGKYVGTTSYLLNPSNVPTPWGNWWGEGDEKVFVDNEPTASIFGTGSEDYYNYSWSSPEIFYFPYCGQPRNDGPGNRGFVTNYRWHILDPIPFKQQIRFYMEFFHHERITGVSYARIGYCYARPGCMDDHIPIMPEDVRFLQLPEAWEPVSKKGSRNARFYQAEDIVLNQADITLKMDRLGAGGDIMVWYPKIRGDKISFKLPVNKEGKKRIYLTMISTPRSGRVKIWLDGEPVLKDKEQMSINLFRPYRKFSRNVSLPAFQWPAGDHTVSLEFLGTEKEVVKPEIALDFIWIQDLKK